MCFIIAKPPGRPTSALLASSEALAPGKRHCMPCFELVGNGVILQEPVDLGAGQRKGSISNSKCAQAESVALNITVTSLEAAHFYRADHITPS